MIGSPVTADLTGGGYQDVIVPTTAGIDIFDGRSGAEVAVLDGARLPELAPGDDDPDGHIGITAAGYYGSNNTGYIAHWEIDNTNVGRKRERGRRVAAVPPRPPTDR